MTTDLKDKVVLITGASTGIGAAAARAFAHAGAKVIVHFNASREAAGSVVSDIRASGGTAALVWGNVSVASNIPGIVREAAAAFGHIDVLINNAGGLVARTPIENYDEAYLSRVLSLNVIQVALFMREIVPLMRARKSGNIINVASIAARHGGGPGSVVYAAAKGFVATATRGWAKELVGDGIRVNAVSPGVIQTPFHDRYTSPQQMEAMRAMIPMGRVGTADECSGTFIYLASDALSGFVTGQVIEVNGGQLMP